MNRPMKAHPNQLLTLAILLSSYTAAAPTATTAGDLRISVRDTTGTPVADAVVIARGPGKAAAVATAVIDQVDKEFVPAVSVIPVGTAVRFPNKDDIRHHVYSFSPAKKFELPLYSGTPAEPVVFERPGVVTLGCNIHDWMLAYVYVTDAPAFSRTGEDGTATLPGLAAGSWEVVVWHPAIKGGKDSPLQPATLDIDGTVELAFALELGKLKKKRRGPSGEDRGY